MALRVAFALAVGTLLWSFVAGAAYLVGVRGALPLRTDALSGARARAAKGDLDGAASEYRKAIRIDALDTRAVYELTSLLLEHGRPEVAATELEEALRARPHDGRLLGQLGDARLAEGRNSEAAALYAQALEQAPREAALWNNLGTAFARQGQLDQAIAAYRASVAIEPAQAAKNLERALREREAR